ncbi:30S ribosomal protein S17 [Haloprofundus marisrubri]|uniref:Small ribosomal subunit protein uS17 n=1 Tax=Haloprofundus marisrubri TaxID=1514971 RepID=A0A0W1R7Z8_9EURY|nr:30S ribosomal protein S17 [Haloprofundus marisrubri]KTG09250.1 30S ribosomal protein S17 [Haloprofundus marisrubri]
MAIGLNVPEPEETCSDENCPFHGSLAVRGQTLEGTVASTDMDKTVVVEREYDVRVPKYDRYMKRRSRVPAHAPPCMELEEGDTVRIAETRPLSKTKSHVVVETIESLDVTEGLTAPETTGDETEEGDA